MISPLKKSHVIENTAPLPAGWVRIHPTTALDDRPAGAGLICTGPRKEFLSRLVAGVDSAKEVVLVASFLLADKTLADAMLRAVERGVRVYALNSSEQRLSRATEADGDFDQRMIDEHKALLDRLAGKVLLRSAEHFHAKFLVADPRGETRGWISTANFNKALEDGVELGVELTRDEARALAAWFNHAFWCEAERELVEKGRLSTVAAPPATPAQPPVEIIPGTGKHSTSLRDAVMEMIRGAKRELLVSSYGLEENHPAVAVLVDLAKHGLKVTVLNRPRPACKAAIAALLAAGAKVLAHEKLHAKAIWADGRGLVMTANLAAQGLDEGFEVGVRLTGDRAEALRGVLMDWANRFPWHFQVGEQLSSGISEFCPAESALKDGVRKIAEEHIEKLPPITARDALKLDDAKQPGVAKLLASNGKVLARKLRVEWEVRPPQLPVNAKERRQQRTVTKPSKDGKPVETVESVPYEPPVYDAGKEVFVLLRRPEDIEPARKLADQLNARVVLK